MELTGHMTTTPHGRDLAERARRIWRRLIVAGLVVLVLHLIFFIFVAPYLKLETAPSAPTEVVQISPQELSRLKEQIRRNNRQLAPLLEQEVREEFRTKEAPKDPKMIGPFNQTVPEETVAGAQRDAPQKGGGGKSGAPKEAKPEKLDLKKLGLGTKLAPPPKPQQRQQEQSIAGPQGPPGIHRPVGRDSDKIKKGTDNLLNAIESAYYSFFVRFDDPIIRNWYFLFNSNEGQIRSEINSRGIKPGAELPVTIEMVLDRKGNFQKIEVVESSGVVILDEIARNAVKKLGAVPNPPEGIFEGKPYFTRHIQLTVHYVDSGGVHFQPNVYW